MTSPRMPERLRLIAERVLAGKPAADIGTDHGLLAVFLACTEHVPRVIASDARPAPLSTARDRVRRARAEARVELRLGSGLEVLAPGEAATVVFAGLGGHTILELASTERLRELRVERLILQASSHHEAALEHYREHLDWRPELTAEGGEDWPWRVDVFDLGRTPLRSGG